MDDALKSLLTNQDVIDMDRYSTASEMNTEDGPLVSWTSHSIRGDKHYLAIFNLSDAPLHIDKTFAEYGYIDKAQYKVRDLWQRKELGLLNSFQVDLPPTAPSSTPSTTNCRLLGRSVKDPRILQLSLLLLQLSVLLLSSRRDLLLLFRCSCPSFCSSSRKDLRLPLLPLSANLQTDGSQ